MTNVGSIRKPMVWLSSAEGNKLYLYNSYKYLWILNLIVKNRT